jgi:tRNA pseudouridine38-40 synthase
VQQALEAVLRERGLARAVMPSGRTDKGVHARMQVLSLAIPKTHPPEELLSLPLPEGLGVLCVKPAHRSFHSQWAATGKEYRYRVQLGPPSSPEWEEKSSPRKPRLLEAAEWRALGGGRFEARLRGDGFARHMVRYLVGSAVAAATGVISPAQYREGLETGAAFPGVRAPGHGLVLWEVRYPDALDPFAAERRIDWEPLRLPPFSER